MINFTLKCAEGHSFTSWFDSNDAFEKLKKAGHLACAICGSDQVEKAMMSPQIASSKKDNAKEGLKDNPTPPVELVKEMSAFIRENAEDVKDQFAHEARLMHLGESKKRMIIGQTSSEERKELKDEGIPIMPIPWYRNDVN